MPKILLIVEDEAQRVFMSALLNRFSHDAFGREPIIRHEKPGPGIGGVGVVKRCLEDYLKKAKKGLLSGPDMILVAVDANCRGFAFRRAEIEKIIAKYRPYSDCVVAAIPDPHIERWLLLDSLAFKKAVGKGCQAPDCKCKKDKYKEMLRNAVRAAGVRPTLGGREYTEDIVNAMDLKRIEKDDDSFGKLCKEIRSSFIRIQRVNPNP